MGTERPGADDPGEGAVDVGGRPRASGTEADAADPGGGSDPAADERANYDYESEAVDRPGMCADLEGFVAGDVRFDSYSRQLYATDASIYEVTPIGVVFPRSTADVSAVVSYCAERGTPVLPRGGGTSLAGQAVGEAVVLDFTRYMDRVKAVDPETRRARAEPGVILERLNAACRPHGLKFAPDPAWGDKSALGGAVGNNSTGAHSLLYGKTDAYIESVEAVLADGTVTRFGWTSLAELRERGDPEGDLEARIYAAVARIVDEEGDVIEAAYPELKRNVSGYNLDWLVSEARRTGEAGEPRVNLARLLAGSEGTLAVVTEAEVGLEPLPDEKAMALLAYDDLVAAMADVEPILAHEPAAVEVLDDVLLDLARETAEFGDLVDETVPAGVEAVLLVEFYVEDEEAGRRRVSELLADRLPGADPEGTSGASEGGTADPSDEAIPDPSDEGAADGDDGEDGPGAPVRAVHADEAHDEADRSRFWKLRKSGLPILLSRTTDEKHVSFIEDTAVPPEHLPSFVSEFQDVLAAHDTYASFYAHAGPGVLHVRPLVDTKSAEGVAAMEEIAAEVTDLVVKYGGSVSGEHGDGRARTQWNRKLYGETVWELFGDLKSAFDPDWLLNPGQVVSRPDEPTDMTENHRFGPDYAFEAGFEPALNWENENGFQGMAELCHGCGGCRGDQDTTGGVMCPTFRASREEITSTRGRANALRQALSGDLPGDPFTDEFVHEVLDLCIGCKGCAHDCPSEVDMAKLKAEIVHEYHRREGASLRDRLFANVEGLSRVGSALAPVSNWATRLPGSGLIAEKALGIARERDLPRFARTSLAEWGADRESAVPEAEADRRVLLLPDSFTNYNHPDAGKAAVRVLEAAGCHVRVADLRGTGRPPFSKGFIERARASAERTVEALAPAVAEGWDVVVVEPSDAVMVQSDYLDLLSGPDVERVAGATYGVCEYVDVHRLDERPAFDAPGEALTYHGHCHQKATARDHHAVAVLRRAGYAVDPLDSGCCGMAGSFGYEAEHYSMSRAVASILEDQVAASDGDLVTAPGASCRAQLAHGEGAAGEPPTPIELVARALDA